MKKHVLVVAHQLELRAKIGGLLQSAGYTVDLAADEKRALHLAADAAIEAAVVVPSSGSVDWKLAQQLHDTVPKIIVLADRADDIARLALLLPPTDALLSQPLNEQELLRSLAEPISHRRENDETGREILLIEGGGKIDLAGSTFFACDGREVLLTRAETSLLAALGRNPGRMLSRDQLCHAAFGHGAEPYERSVDMHLARLRRKIEPDPKVPRFILTVPKAGYKLVVTRPALALPDKPSIAVLPFENLSGDAEQDYFADGVVEDIITALSRMRWLFVIARNSTFTYRGRAVDVRQVGRELGVRYVLEGSLRKWANRVRVSAQLVDASTGAHLWGDRFDNALDDIFELQDQLTTSVVCAIAPKLEQAEIARATSKPTESLDAYDYFLKGMASFHQWAKEDVQEALRLFSRAIELDPKFAAAYGAAAQCYANRKANGSMADRAQEAAEAAHLARRAVALGRDDAFALSSAGNALAYVAGDLEGGIDCIDRALVLNPNLAAAWYYGGWVRIFLGQPDAAIEHLGRAMRLSPLDPRIGLMETAMAFGHYLAGRDDEASRWADRAVRDAPDFIAATYISSASHALAGRPEIAERAMAHARQFDPARRISNLKDDIPLRRLEDYSRLAEGLRKAGLPE
jgi:TolB-like protein/DNA-binding response OmpR family regulator/Tfp pilus assembly protein PilF